MSAPEGLAGIIARLEEATEGSRELDAAIFRFVGLTEQQERHCRDWCRMDRRTDLTRDRYVAAWAPDYTTSLDAALPGENIVHVERLSKTLWIAWARSDAGGTYDSFGRSEALARRCAALRARATSAKEHP